MGWEIWLKNHFVACSSLILVKSWGNPEATPFDIILHCPYKDEGNKGH